MHAIIQSASMPWLYMLPCQSACIPLLCMLLYRLPVCPSYACYYPVCQYALTIHATMPVWLYTLTMHATKQAASMPCPWMLLSSVPVCPDYTCYHASLPVCPYYACYYPVCQYTLTIHAIMPVGLHSLTMHATIQTASMPCLCILLSSLPVCPEYTCYHASLPVYPNFACYYTVCPYAMTVHDTMPVFLYALTTHATIQAASMPCLCRLLHSLPVRSNCTCYHFSLTVFPNYAYYYTGCQYALPMQAIIQSASTL